MKLPDYPQTKPSGFQGLGHLPNHWKVIRGRFVMRVNPPAPRLRSLKPEDEVSFVPMDVVGELGGLALDHTRVISDVSSGFTEFQDGDVVVAKITPCFENGKTALARGLLNGAAYGTTELHVLRAGETLDRGFLFYVAISDRFRKLGESEMYGAGGQKRVPPEFNKDFPMPIPAVPEQQQIAAFLDWKTGQIDALIGKKKELLEKLKEKRIAVITQAVTQGINPTAALRDSGIPWLGQVPEHWEVLQIGRMITLQRGVDITKDEQEEGDVPVVSSGGVASYHNVALVKGPGVVVGRKGTAGALYYIESDYWPHDTTLYVRDFWGNHPRFVYYKLLSMNLESYDTGTANPTINRNVVHPVKVSWPPVKEQIAICQYLDRASESIGAMAAKIKEAIDLLSEYRAALITAATTGKIDVRRVKIPQFAA